eukprot:12244409-Alexandrium_andersonii.AAC.1
MCSVGSDPCEGQHSSLCRGRGACLLPGWRPAHSAAPACVGFAASPLGAASSAGLLLPMCASRASCQ